MIQIVGTIRDTVNLAKLDSQWQQKKNNLGRKRELTPQEQQLQRYREELAQMREDRKRAAINNKLKAGATLTPEEIAYLKKNNPMALKEYEELQREREAYRRQLRNCRSKEEVEQLKVNKMNGYLSQVKSISSNPNIPKGEKLAQLERIMKQLAGIEEEHIEFTKSAQYHNLPEKTGEKDTAEEVSEKPETEGVESPEKPEAEGAEPPEKPEAKDAEAPRQSGGKEAGLPEKPTFEGVMNEIKGFIYSLKEPTKRSGVDVSI